MQVVAILDKKLKNFIFTCFNFSSSVFQNIPLGRGFSAIPDLSKTFKYLKKIWWFEKLVQWIKSRTLITKPFMNNVEKWLNIFWQFLNIMHERTKPTSISNEIWRLHMFKVYYNYSKKTSKTLFWIFYTWLWTNSASTSVTVITYLYIFSHE